MTDIALDRIHTQRVLTRTALVVLGAAVIIGGVALVPVSATLADRWPEFAGLRMPLLTLALTYLVTVLAAIVSIGALLSARGQAGASVADEIRPSTALVVIAAVQVVLLAVVMVLIPGPPALGFAVTALTLATLVGLVNGVRSLNRRRARV